MIRKVLRPQQTNFIINIPESYIGKKVEFIMFTLDENDKMGNIEEKERKSLRGTFKQYADISKVSLEDKAWQNSIIEKSK